MTVEIIHKFHIEVLTLDNNYNLYRHSIFMSVPVPSPTYLLHILYIFLTPSYTISHFYTISLYISYILSSSYSFSSYSYHISLSSLYSFIHIFILTHNIYTCILYIWGFGIEFYIINNLSACFAHMYFVHFLVLL